jgi:hypothetical protein
MEAYQKAGMQPSYVVDDSQSALLRSVFGWMFLGLAVTGVTSLFVLGTPALLNTLLGGPMFVLMFAELGLVFWLSARAMKMSASKATGVFLLYSALNGITLAPLAFMYTGHSISSAFAIAGTMFGVMAMYGYVTKRDLSGWGSFLFMGLIGVILASIVSFFMGGGGMMSFIINIVGVIVFVGLTAYDVQKIKRMGASMGVGGDVGVRQVSILGALSLYLNFINMFIFILRLIGDRD